MKKVAFDENQNKVHLLKLWLFAYRSARKGPWESMVLDSLRFKSRIETCAKIIDPILTINHRCIIYNERFK